MSEQNRRGHLYVLTKHQIRSEHQFIPPDELGNSISHVDKYITNTTFGGF